MLTCTFNGWIILWTKGRIPSMRPPPTFLRNLCLRGGGRLQGYSNCYNCLFPRHVILQDFAWHVQCMVHDSRTLGWFNPLFFEPVGTSPHPAIWLRKVGLLSSQSEPWVDATCTPRVCRQPSSSEPAVLGRACFASCTGQMHCYSLLYSTKIPCLIKPELCRVVRP